MRKPVPSSINHGAGGTAFVGLDATRLFAARALASGLKLYARSRLMPNRHWTPSVMLRAASNITHKTYKRGDYLKAAADVTLWADTMQAALPHEEDA